MAGVNNLAEHLNMTEIESISEKNGSPLSASEKRDAILRMSRAEKYNLPNADADKGVTHVPYSEKFMRPLVITKPNEHFEGSDPRSAALRFPDGAHGLRWSRWHVSARESCVRGHAGPTFAGVWGGARGWADANAR